MIIFFGFIYRSYFVSFKWPIYPTFPLLFAFVLKASESQIKPRISFGLCWRMIDWLMVNKGDVKDSDCLGNIAPHECRTLTGLPDAMTTTNEQQRWNTDGWHIKTVDFNLLCIIMPKFSSPAAWQYVTCLVDLRTYEVRQLLHANLKSRGRNCCL